MLATAVAGWTFETGKTKMRKSCNLVAVETYYSSQERIVAILERAFNDPHFVSPAKEHGLPGEESAYRGGGGAAAWRVKFPKIAWLEETERCSSRRKRTSLKPKSDYMLLPPNVRYTLPSNAQRSPILNIGRNHSQLRLIIGEDQRSDH